MALIPTFKNEIIKFPLLKVGIKATLKGQCCWAWGRTGRDEVRLVREVPVRSTRAVVGAAAHADRARVVVLRCVRMVESHACVRMRACAWPVRAHGKPRLELVGVLPDVAQHVRLRARSTLEYPSVWETGAINGYSSTGVSL